MSGEERESHFTSVNVYTARTTRDQKPAAVIFCSTICVSQGEMYAPGLSENATLKSVKPDRKVCLHCYNCGVLCYEPSECNMHPELCPDNSWQLRGFQAMGFIRSWRTLTEESNPSPDAWEIAQCLGSLNPDMNFVELAQIVREEIENQ
jgi:hypothetical protein